jgi:hypothetical protein
MVVCPKIFPPYDGPIHRPTMVRATALPWCKLRAKSLQGKGFRPLLMKTYYLEYKQQEAAHTTQSSSPLRPEDYAFGVLLLFPIRG